jgi:hypothetical protein
MGTPGARGRSGLLRVGSTLLGVLGLAICVAFVYDIVWEPLFDESYLHWYLENGSVVNLLLGSPSRSRSLWRRPSSSWAKLAADL